MATKRVVVVGAGQIGSRHVEGLARARLNLAIEVVDPVAAARELALQRFDGADGRGGVKTIRAIASIEESAFGGTADLAIVATTATSRHQAVRAVLERMSIPLFVMEKVLFQRIADIDDIEARLAASGARAWVYCSRRLFPHSRELKDLFAGQRIQIYAVGGNWGLGCNGIHLLDYLAYLSGEPRPETWNIECLDPLVYHAKRDGYREFGGTLAFGLAGGHTVAMKDDKSRTSPLVIDIVGEQARVTLIELCDVMFVSRRQNAWRTDRVKIGMPWTSELTNQVAEDLLTKGTCGLTEYKEAAAAHRVFLTALLSHMQAFMGVRLDTCPIT